jgi:hypothetical protein
MGGGVFCFALYVWIKFSVSMITRNYFFVGLFCLAGCASVVDLEDVGTQQDANWLGGDVSRTVLVVGYAYDSAKRSAFEREMVLALRSRGISAEASESRMPALSLVTESALTDYLESSPDTAVLLVRALSVTLERSRTLRDDSTSVLFKDAAVRWEVSTGAQLEGALYVHGRPDSVWTEWTRLRAGESIGEAALTAYANRLLESMTRDGVTDRLL